MQFFMTRLKFQVDLILYFCRIKLMSCWHTGVARPSVQLFIALDVHLILSWKCALYLTTEYMAICSIWHKDLLKALEFSNVISQLDIAHQYFKIENLDAYSLSHVLSKSDNSPSTLWVTPLAIVGLN